VTDQHNQYATDYPQWQAAIREAQAEVQRKEETENQERIDAERAEFTSMFQTVLDYLGIPATADGRHSALEDYQFYLVKGIKRGNEILFDVQVRMSSVSEPYPPIIHGHTGEEALRTMRRAQVADAIDRLFNRWGSQQYTASKHESSRAEQLLDLFRQILREVMDEHYDF